jgi:hypothetical protein
MPHIVIEQVPVGSGIPWELGSSNLRMTRNLLLYVFAETDWERDKIIEEDKSINPNTGKYSPHNLYFNEMYGKITEGWIIFLDDDDNLIGENCIVAPYAFSDGTADWYKEKYGKVCSYSHAGEVFMIATPDTVYFEIKRHF